MEPTSLTLPEPLAEGWATLLARDGFRTDVDPEGRSGTIAPDGRAARVTIIGRRMYQPDHLGREVWRRLERMLLASGAVYDQPDREAEFIRVLYRVPGPPDAVIAALRAQGVTVEVAEQPATGGRSGDGWLLGEVSQDRHRANLETGPALDPTTGATAHFVEIRPQYGLRMRPGMVELLQRVDSALRSGGAVLVMTLRPLR